MNNSDKVQFLQLDLKIVKAVLADKHMARPGVSHYQVMKDFGFGTVYRSAGEMLCSKILLGGSADTEETVVTCKTCLVRLENLYKLKLQKSNRTKES